MKEKEICEDLKKVVSEAKKMGCTEVAAFRNIPLENVEIVIAALEMKAKYEKQWLGEVNNPLEPLKLSSALNSELFKMEYRKNHKPEDVNILDYTVIAALKDCLERYSVKSGNEAAKEGIRHHGKSNLLDFRNCSTAYCGDTSASKQKGGLGFVNGVGKGGGIKICVTGHRPGKMYGYDLSDVRYQALKEKFKEILIREGCREGITGMALGVDTVFALAVLELKEEGYPIKLHCAIPCRNQSRLWRQESKKLYEEILENADIVHLVSDDEYKPYLMQKRNTYMVDLSDKVIAVWDRSPSGTGNCVAYAQKKGKEVIRIAP